MSGVLEQRFDVVVFLADAFERFGDGDVARTRLRASCLSTMRIALATSFANVLRTHLSRSALTFLSGILALVFAGFLRELIDRLDDLLDLAVRELDRAEEIFLGNFVARRLRPS